MWNDFNEDDQSYTNKNKNCSLFNMIFIYLVIKIHKYTGS